MYRKNASDLQHIEQFAWCKNSDLIATWRIIMSQIICNQGKISTTKYFHFTIIRLSNWLRRSSVRNELLLRRVGLKTLTQSICISAAFPLYSSVHPVVFRRCGNPTWRRRNCCIAAMMNDDVNDAIRCSAAATCHTPLPRRRPKGDSTRWRKNDPLAAVGQKAPDISQSSASRHA